MEKKIPPNLTLFTLTIDIFAIGSAELTSVGLLPMVVKSFHISLSQASLTVSLYTLGVTTGMPLLTILTRKWNCRSLMLGVMLLFISGNLIAVPTPMFIILLVGRVLSALTHDTFMSVSTVIAADIVLPSRRANAIAIMSTGLAATAVAGVSLGMLVGQQIAWRIPLLFITSIGLVGLIADYSLTPKNLSIPGKAGLKRIARIFTNKPFAFSLLTTAFGYGGTFATCTYLSLLLENLGFSANVIVTILVVYGVMAATDNTVSGHRANKKPLDSLVGMPGLLTMSLVFLFIIVLVDNSLLGLLVSLMLSLSTLMNVSDLQLYIVKLAEKYVPEDTILALVFNIVAFNIRTTVGSMTGRVVTNHLSVTYTPILGGFIVLIAILFVPHVRRQGI